LQKVKSQGFLLAYMFLTQNCSLMAALHFHYLYMRKTT